MPSITIHSYSNRICQSQKFLPEGLAEKMLHKVAQVICSTIGRHHATSLKPESYINQNMIDPVIGPEIQRVLR